MFNQRGQSVVEAVIVLPALLLGISSLFAAVLMLGTTVSLRDQLDETLVCFTYQSESQCRKRWERFLSNSGLKPLVQTSAFQRGAFHWTAKIEVRLPGGFRWKISRQIPARLGGNKVSSAF